MNKEIDTLTLLCLCFTSIFFGFVICGFIFIGNDTISLNQETGDTICQQIANYEGNYSTETIKTITAESKKGELICNFPSYDHTQLIKFKSNVD